MDKRGKQRSQYGKEKKAESTYGMIPTPRAMSQSVYKAGVTSRPISDTDIGPALQVLQSKNYKIIDKLGEGNYAKVFRVRSLENRDLAVKIIDLAKTSKNYRLKFFPREVEVLQKLRHKNITAIYEIFTAHTMVFIFMEYCSNGTAADLLKQFKELPDWICKPFFTQLVEALHYMHSLNIAHRDIKLENILLDRQTNPKLTDFSYSLYVEKDGQGNTILSKTFCGSLPYIPPEILLEKPYDPKAADIWSLGVCLYILLNNTLPFKFDDIQNMIRCQLNREYKFKARVENSISDKCKDLLKKMLEPDFKQRITTIGIMLHPWLSSRDERPQQQ
ncbi:testis-specific serine/threonine-protein kinase 1-like isoform X3 [Dinothrombium tinctorium]|uniref:Testis-specific serine/threonine-protein kinase 1-like isoform X3 n=1 Tax=Dinothrombium tinctorium TaxID=1965070 RepID=A0A3S3P9W8_9ACAR|nr:testis-specific serine/threonine-protein kinase 1-like isoform X3 [Dinothrombium tinctorium]